MSLTYFLKRIHACKKPWESVTVRAVAADHIANNQKPPQQNLFLLMNWVQWDLQLLGNILLSMLIFRMCPFHNLPCVPPKSVLIYLLVKEHFLLGHPGYLLYRYLFYISFPNLCLTTCFGWFRGILKGGHLKHGIIVRKAYRSASTYYKRALLIR